MFIGPCIIAIVDEWKTNLMSLVIFYVNSYALNMFRTLIYPSSGACDCVDELPHRSSCSQYVVCCSFCCGWYLVVFVLQLEALVHQPVKRTPPNISRSKNSNTQRTENKTTDVVIHQQSRRFLKMDILMSETCWAHNNSNKITSDIKLVFHSSAILSVCSYSCVSYPARKWFRFCAVFYCHLWTVWLCHIFPHCLANVARFSEKKIIGYKMCVLIFCTTVVWNISHCKKNSLRGR